VSHLQEKTIGTSQTVEIQCSVVIGWWKVGRGGKRIGLLIKCGIAGFSWHRVSKSHPSTSHRRGNVQYCTKHGKLECGNFESYFLCANSFSIASSLPVPTHSTATPPQLPLPLPPPLPLKAFSYIAPSTPQSRQWVGQTKDNDGSVMTAEQSIPTDANISSNNST